MKRVLAQLFVLAFLCTGAAWAGGGLDAEAGAEIRAVIEAQMAAFQRDDAEAAFAFAAPDIQARFVSPANFMRMVREGYRPVYRPREVVFGEIFTLGGKPVQRVRVVGPDGNVVIADYVMVRQPDGSWRIDGCYLSETGEGAI